MERVTNLFETISEMKPIVDNPAGLMHNYMARKPYNIVGAIIEGLTKEGDVVFDPMAGSGTTSLEAAKRNRFSLASDVNPVANMISCVTLQDWDVSRVSSLIDAYLDELTSANEAIYGIRLDGKPAVIERTHFRWDGEHLVPEEFWYKLVKGDGSYAGRRKASADEAFCACYESFSDWKIEVVSDDLLIPNSRIAIPEGRSVYDYFCYRNLAFLDLAKKALLSHEGDYGYEVLRLLFSSAINLVKISDKKASSQIPYWIPKKNVTSRNGVFVFQKKAKAILEGIRYCKDNIRARYTPGHPFDYRGTPKSYIYPGGAQNIPNKVLPDNIVSLIVTDPPYTDQVPYVEYGQLTSAVMDISLEDALEDELVVSDAPSRGKDADDFSNLFARIMRRSWFSLKEHGFVVMFYHSFDLRSWDQIISLMEECGFSYVDQMPVPAPRKSFKAVMSPGRTLDGNYLIVFEKSDCNRGDIFDGDLEMAESLAKTKAAEIFASGASAPLQVAYDGGLLRDAIEKGYLHTLASRHKTFARIVQDVVGED